MEKVTQQIFLIDSICNLLTIVSFGIPSRQVTLILESLDLFFKNCQAMNEI